MKCMMFVQDGMPMPEERGSKWGGKRPGAGRPSRKSYIEKIAEPFRLSPDVPSDPSEIALAQFDKERYGVSIDEEWFGAGQALQILKYLELHRDWLEQKAKENLYLKNQQ